jgi:HSP20 family protein
MKKAVITKSSGDAGSESLFGQMETSLQKIRSRAFELFQSRGSAGGDPLADWLNAERDLFLIPDNEFEEDAKEYSLRVMVPGFTAEQLSVAVEPNCVTIRGEAEQKSKKKKDGTETSEFSRSETFRRFELSSAIDTAAAEASLEDGVLKLTLPKIAAKQESRPERVLKVVTAA